MNATRLLSMIFVGALLIAGMRTADAANFLPISSIATNTTSDLLDVSNLIQGPGAGFSVNEPHEVADPILAANWATDNPGGDLADYYALDPPLPHPVLIVDLGADVTLTEISTWGASGDDASSAKTFTLRFATQTEGILMVGTSVTYAPNFEADLDPVLRDSHRFSQPVSARYVEITITDNWFGHAGALGAGPRVALGEIAFERSLVVDTLVDENDGLETGDASLREAIAAAATGDTIRFDPALDGGTISLDGTELSIDKNLTIDASSLPGGLTISGGGSSRVLSVNAGASLTLDSLAIAGGVADTGAGLLIASGATVTVLNSAFFGNTADPGEGGAIVNRGTLAMINSTVSGNRADANLGGGLSNLGRATLRHVTMASNSAVVGGGIYHAAGAQVELVLENCIVAGNTAGSGNNADIRREGAIETVISNGVNLIGDHSTVETLFPLGSLAGNAANPLDPNLASLNDYGGPTVSMALLSGSPAIDAAEALADVRSSDQRGFAGRIGVSSDLGAYELGETLVLSADDAGPGTLRAAIEAPNTGNVIRFDPAVFDGSPEATISLSSELTVVGRVLAVDASSLASEVRVSGSGGFRVLSIDLSSHVTIDSLAIVQGFAPSGEDGGGIKNLGTLRAQRCLFRGHTSDSTGGAIFSSGLLSLRESTIDGNFANSGGGLFNAASGQATVVGSTISNNQSTGIANEGALVLTNTTVAKNQSNPSTEVRGGGIHNIGTLSVLNCTVTENEAAVAGGGIRSTSEVLFVNSIIAGNSPRDLDGRGTIESVNNFIGDYDSEGVLFDGFNGNRVGSSAAPLDAELAPLGKFGGPTATAPPLPGSPVIDAGANTTLLTDQRGFPRLSGSAVDIGAVERGPSVTVTRTDDSGPGSLRAALENAVEDTTIGFDLSLAGMTIRLTSGELTVSNRRMVIDGSGPARGITISAEGLSRIFDVRPNAELRLHDLMLTDGDTSGSDILGGVDGGGGIRNQGTLHLERCSIARCATGTEGLGGGIYNAPGATLTMRNSTLTGNIADLGGGISVQGGSADLTHVTIAENYAGSAGGGLHVSSNDVRISNSIIAGNRALSSGPDIETASAATVILIGENLLSDLDGSGLTEGTNTVLGDPRLAPLADYGGPTHTMTLLHGSPAIDAAGVSSLDTDQRGYPRVGPADIGALEAGPATSVTNTNDSGAGSLRDAIAAANVPGARILFSVDPINNRVVLSSGELVVPGGFSVLFDASNSAVTLDGNNLSRVLRIDPNSVVALHSLGITGGRAGAGVNGGGILNSGRLTLIQSTVRGNESDRGGGISSFFGNLTILHSTVHSNIATELGGGLELGQRTRIVNSTIANNQSPLGGGIFSFNDSVLFLDQVTVSGNTSANGGGGLVNQETEFHINNSIIAGNTSTLGPPDIRLGGGTVTRSGSNVVGRNDSVTDAFPAGSPNAGGDFVGTSISPLDPVLGSLDDYGGSTLTMALLAGSPALNTARVTNTTSLTDQRGFPRVLGTGLDIGAFEAAAGEFNQDGLTLYASGRQTNLIAGGVDFQISTSPEFRQTVSTLAGTGVSGNAGGSVDDAEFNFPSDVAEDSRGFLFVADSANHRIRMISPSGVVTTIAGTGAFGFVNGIGTLAKFGFPSGIAVGPDDDVYVSDTLNHALRKLTRPEESGLPWVITTLAGSGRSGFMDGIGTFAQFSRPHGLTLDAEGNVYVADTSNHRIRKVTPAGTVTTFAGNGVAGLSEGFRLNAQFSFPFDVAFDSSGNLFVADRDNHRIRRVALDNQVTTVAGRFLGFDDGFGTPPTPSFPADRLARFNSPTGIALDAASNLVIADAGNHAIRKVTRPVDAGSPWIVSTLAGTGTSGFADGGTALDGARFNGPTDLAVAADGAILVADGMNHRIRRIADPLSVTGIPGRSDRFGQEFRAVINAASLGLDPDTIYYFRSVASDGSLRTTGEAFTLLPVPIVETLPASLITRTGATMNALLDPNGSSTEMSFDYSTEPDLAGPLRVTTLADALSGPSGMAVDAVGNVYVAERLGHKIVQIDPAGVVSDFAGTGIAGFANGPGSEAQFDQPSAIAIDGAGNLYVSDEQNHRIRKITPAGAVTTLAGTGVAGFKDALDAAEGQFLFPSGLAVTQDGSSIYVADRGNHRIRLIAGGGLTTLAGSGTAGFAGGEAGTAQFNHPTGLAVDALGNVYVADRDNHRIRLVNADGLVLAVAGSGTAGFLDDIGLDAQFAFPSDVSIRDNRLYVADRGNHRLRLIDSAGVVSTLAGSGLPGIADSLPGSLSPASAAQFSSPTHVALDTTGTVYLTEEGSQRVRRIARESRLSITLPQIYEGDSVINLSAAVPETLVAGMTYYFRARANSAQAEIVGEILSFTTAAEPVIALFEGSSTTAPDLIPGQPAPIDFGTTALARPVVRELTMANLGEWELTVTAINLPDGFEATNSAGVLAGGASLTLTLTLQASQAGVFGGNLEILSDDPNQGVFSVPLSGVVLDPPAVTTLAASVNSATSVTLNASVNPKNSATTVWFAYSESPELEGVKVSTLTGAVPGYAEGAGTNALFNTPWGMAVDPDGILYIADTANHRIRKIMPDGSSMSVAGTGVAGFSDGPGGTAQFNQPVGLALDADGSLFVSDSENHRIRKISPSGEVTTHSGLGEPGFTDGVRTAARFSFPWGLALDPNGNVYVADRQNHRIRRVAPDGTASTLAGTGISGFANGAGNQAQFNGPAAVALGSSGILYVTEFGNQRIRGIALDGTVSTLAGSAASGFVDATGGTARFNNPRGLAIDLLDQLVVADQGNHRLRMVTATGVVTTLAGSGTPGTLDGLGPEARFDEPFSVAATSSGEIFAAESSTSAIRRISSAITMIEAATNLNGSGDQLVSLAISPAATCHFRALASNGGGTTLGEILICTIDRAASFQTWVTDAFGANAANVLIAGPAADPDEDDYHNLLEYAFNLDPMVYSECPVMIVYEGGGATITYPRRTDINDLAYRAEWSTDLDTWKVEGITEEVPAGQAAGPTENVVATLAPSVLQAALASEFQLFIRVTVTQP